MLMVGLLFLHLFSFFLWLSSSILILTKINIFCLPCISYFGKYDQDQYLQVKSDWWMHYGLRLNELCAWGSMLLQQQPVLLLAWLYNTHMLIYLLDLESWSRWLHRVSVITSNIGLMVHIPHHYVSESNKTKPIPVISSHKCSHQGHSNFKERSSSWYTVICQAALHTLLQVNWHKHHHVTIAGI